MCSGITWSESHSKFSYSCLFGVICLLFYVEVCHIWPLRCICAVLHIGWLMYISAVQCSALNWIEYPGALSPAIDKGLIVTSTGINCPLPWQWDSTYCVNGYKKKCICNIRSKLKIESENLNNSVLHHSFNWPLSFSWGWNIFFLTFFNLSCVQQYIIPWAKKKGLVITFPY